MSRLHFPSVHESRVTLPDEVNTVSMFGMPGAGKETVTQDLLHGFEQADVETRLFEVGSLVRKAIQERTSFGLYVSKLPKGALVPDVEIIREIRNGIAGLAPEALWFLDGFPRSMAQVPVYEEEMEMRNRHDVMIHLQLNADPQIEREISEERMRKRGEAAIRAGMQPRADDVDPAARARRLDESEVLKDVAGYFKQKNKLVVVDASQAIEDVRSDTRELFRSRLYRRRSFVA